MQLNNFNAAASTQELSYADYNETNRLRFFAGHYPDIWARVCARAHNPEANHQPFWPSLLDVLVEQRITDENGDALTQVARLIREGYTAMTLPQLMVLRLDH